MSRLLLVRHGESEWNANGMISGLADIGLTPLGKKQAKECGKQLITLPIHKAYISKLRRAFETFSEVQRLADYEILCIEDARLNERDFGTLTGRLKSDVVEEIGLGEYEKVMHSWSGKAPHGESLADVYNRCIPIIKTEICSDLQNGLNVLVVSHHQTLRAFLKFLENISEESIAGIRFDHMRPQVFEFDPHSRVPWRKL